MHLKLTRMRRGEILAATAAAALVAFLLLLPWFGSAGRSVNGWHGLPVLRWLLLVVAALGLALGWLQASCRAPALPVTLAVFVTTISLAATIALIVRLPTSAAVPRVGAYLGLVATAAVTVGGFWSMRDEDGWVPDAEHPVERLSIGG